MLGIFRRAGCVTHLFGVANTISSKAGKYFADHVLRPPCEVAAVWTISGRWRCSSSDSSGDSNERTRKLHDVKETKVKEKSTFSDFEEDGSIKSIDAAFDIHSTDFSSIEYLREPDTSYLASEDNDFPLEVDHDNLSYTPSQTEPVFHSEAERTRYILSEARQLGDDMTKHFKRKQELQNQYMDFLNDSHASYDDQHCGDTFSSSENVNFDNKPQFNIHDNSNDVELKKSSGTSRKEYYNSVTEVEENESFDTTKEDMPTTMSDMSDDMFHEEQEKGIESYRDIIEETLPGDLQFLDIGRPREVKEELKKGRARRKRQLMISGEADPEVPPSSVRCQGCGAYLQCCDGMAPGFLPSTKFKSLSEDQLWDVTCQRCLLLTNHKIALDVNVSKDHYVEVLSPLKEKKNTLIIVMVDLLDFPCSIFPNLLDLVGKDKWLVIVGNKFDLLPPDGSSYKRRMEDELFMACRRAGLHDNKNIKHLCLISAKTGYGVEALITEIQTMWAYRGDVYLLGNTNVGKSTLFNRLLESDFCQQKAAEVFQRATISQWPGTTLSLLRFPMVNPTRKARLGVRKKRLWERNKQLRDRPTKEMKKMERKAYVVGHVGRTDGQPLYEDENERELSFSASLKKMSGDPDDAWTMAQGDMFHTEGQAAEDTAPSLSRLAQSFERGKWVCDTPGFINDEQILHLLTPEELDLVVPSGPLVPRTAVLKPAHTLFLAALGRIDYLEGLHSIFLTVFASRALPLHVCTLERADDLYARHAGKVDLLKVPMGGDERMESFPPLVPTDVTITGVDHKYSAADLVMSSAGWVSVTPDKWTTAQLRVYTPGGLGFHLRPRALLPNAVNFKGKRHNSKRFRAFYRPIAIDKIKEISRKYK